MKDVLVYLDEREDEFNRHISIARMLEKRVDELADDGYTQIEVRHVNTIKSGLLIHLYNIVEAVTTRTLRAVGEEVVTAQPGRWTDSIMREWVRAEIWSGEERIGEGALTRLTEVSGTLACGGVLAAFEVKGASGSWDDKAIKKVADRLGCRLDMSREVSRGALERVYRNETSSLKYLAERRNAIAHGEATFEDGARDLTLSEISALAARVLPFLRAVCVSYQVFLDGKSYLVSEENVA